MSAPYCPRCGRTTIAPTVPMGYAGPPWWCTCPPAYVGGAYGWPQYNPHIDVLEKQVKLLVELVRSMSEDTGVEIERLSARLKALEDYNRTRS